MEERETILQVTDKEIRISGTKIDLMALLAQLINKLLENTNLTEEDIKLSVNLGLMSEEKRTEKEKQLDEARKKAKEMPDFIKKFLEEL